MPHCPRTVSSRDDAHKSLVRLFFVPSFGKSERPSLHGVKDMTREEVFFTFLWYAAAIYTFVSIVVWGCGKSDLSSPEGGERNDPARSISINGVRLFDKNLSIGEENEKTLAEACKAFIQRKEEEMEAANLLERWMVGPKPTAPAIPAPSLLEIEKVKTL